MDEITDGEEAVGQVLEFVQRELRPTIIAAYVGMSSRLTAEWLESTVEGRSRIAASTAHTLRIAANIIENASAAPGTASPGD